MSMRPRLPPARAAGAAASRSSSGSSSPSHSRCGDSPGFAMLTSCGVGGSGGERGTDSKLGGWGACSRRQPAPAQVPRTAAKAPRTAPSIPTPSMMPPSHLDVFEVHAVRRALVEGHAGSAPDLAQPLQDRAPAVGRAQASVWCTAAHGGRPRVGAQCRRAQGPCPAAPHPGSPVGCPLPSLPQATSSRAHTYTLVLTAGRPDSLSSCRCPGRRAAARAGCSPLRQPSRGERVVAPAQASRTPGTHRQGAASRPGEQPAR